MIINIRALPMNTVRKWQVPDNLDPKALRVQTRLLHPDLFAIGRAKVQLTHYFSVHEFVDRVEQESP
jgi:hypothetical protein